MNKDFSQVGPHHDFDVPVWYDPSDIFKRFRQESGIEMTTEVNTENYPNASYRLAPGMKLRVTIVEVRENVRLPPKDCIEYFESRKAAFTNVHGLMLTYLELPHIFNSFSSYKSLDTKKNLYLDSHSDNLAKGAVKGRPRLPYLLVRNDKPVLLSHAVYGVIGHNSRLLMFHPRD